MQINSVVLSMATTGICVCCISSETGQTSKALAAICCTSVPYIRVNDGGWVAFYLQQHSWLCWDVSFAELWTVLSVQSALTAEYLKWAINNNSLFFPHSCSLFPSLFFLSRPQTRLHGWGPLIQKLQHTPSVPSPVLSFKSCLRHFSRHDVHQPAVWFGWGGA